MDTQTTKRNIVKGHRITWWVYAGAHGQPLQRIRHARNMRGHWPGWDATCECGWSSNTGGAVKSTVASEVWFHKWRAANA